MPGNIYGAYHKDHGEDRHDDQRRTGAKEHTGDHWDDGPGRGAGDRPCQCNGEDPLAPAVDDPGARRTADGTAEADREGHDGLALKSQLCHCVVKHIRDPGHVADLLDEAEDQRDAEHKANHGDAKVRPCGSSTKAIRVLQRLQAKWGIKTQANLRRYSASLQGPLHRSIGKFPVRLEQNPSFWSGKKSCDPVI